MPIPSHFNGAAGVNPRMESPIKTYQAGAVYFNGAAGVNPRMADEVGRLGDGKGITSMGPRV